VALVTCDARGLIATVDTYARPWPWLGVIRDRIAMLDPNLADPGLGSF
jgi:hypothetical protein